LAEIIAGVAGQILGSNDISLAGNFFDSGLNSLSIVRMIAALEQKLGRQIPLIAAFQNPSPSLLAEWIVANNENVSLRDKGDRAIKRKLLRPLRKRAVAGPPST
jgi:phthiocerol/phenolphthiocerol synthesis type-I polyketide synthase E